jgi:hypothetical protein
MKSACATLYRCVCCAVVVWLCVVMDVHTVWRQRCTCQSLARNYCPFDVKTVKNYSNRIVTSMNPTQKSTSVFFCLRRLWRKTCTM